MSSKRRRQNRRNQRNRNNKRKNKKSKGEFNISAYICIRKQREGVGIVNKTSGKNSYLIAFKNGKWGWYRSSKINSITEQDYNDASCNFIIDKNLPSPSPTPSMSYSPAPSPINDDITNTKNIQSNNQQIKFKDSMEQNDIDDHNKHDQSQESKIHIKIDQIDESETKNTENNDEKNEESALKTLTESNPNIEVIDTETVDIQVKQNDTLNEENKSDQNDNVIVTDEFDKENNKIAEPEMIPTQNPDDDMEQVEKDKSDEIIVSSEINDDENIEIKSETQVDDDTKQEIDDKFVKDVKTTRKSKDKKDKKQKIEKVNTPKISKFEKKMKLYYKVKDLRERSFLIMCDENKTIDLKSLYEYVEHFGKSKPSKSKVKEFLDYMKPNGSNLVSFSKFVKAIDDDGDVIAAFDRFKKYGNARYKK